MFELEAEIKAWRENLERQRVGDGEILDELESHLRDEIGRSIKTGMAQADAFTSAAMKIGAVSELKREFRKVSRKHIVVKAGLLILGWLAAGLTLWYCSLGLCFHWNFWNWEPTWDMGAAICLSGIGIALTSIWFLAGASRDVASRTGSLLICVACLIFAIILAIYEFPKEQVGNGFFGRSRPSPLWFRGSMVLLWCIPMLMWFWSLKRSRRAAVKPSAISVKN